MLLQLQASARLLQLRAGACVFHFLLRGLGGRRPVGSCSSQRSNVRLPISLCLNVRPPISLCLPGVRPGGVGARSYIESTGGGRAVRNCRTPGNTNLGTFLVRVSIGSASSGSSCWADPNGMIPWSEGVGESVRDFSACAARRPACAARLPRGQSVSRWQWRSSLGPLQATCACDARLQCLDHRPLCAPALLLVAMAHALELDEVGPCVGIPMAVLNH